MIPTGHPTMSRVSIMRGVIASSLEDEFPNSVFQVRALSWLVDDDPANLAVDTDPTTLLERYTVALFYFATVGEYWTNENNFLTSNAVCSWSGLECNDQGFITTMDLGTCLLAPFCLSSCKSVRLLPKYALMCPRNRFDFRAKQLEGSDTL
jgi:hypothetical protein